MSPNIRAGIPRKQKTGDGYMNPYFLAHENFQDAHKNSQKGSKSFKPRIHKVVSTETNIAKIWLSLHFMFCVKFAWYCGKMYNSFFCSYTFA